MNAASESSQSYQPDDRNDDVTVYVNGEFKSKHDASVSIFDSGFVLGDGVWEGIRLVQGRLIAVDEHMERLYQGAASISLDIGIPRKEMVGLIRQTLKKNDMTDGVHIRLMVSRGLKSTPNQDPRFLLGKATIVIVAEYKVVDQKAKSKGLSLFTSTFRCSSPDVFDLRLNSHSRLNFIQALIQAINAGANEALMLDPHGFVASCNSTNFFIVRNGELWTSTGRYNFNGITHRTIMRLARENGITVHEKDFTLAETYTADEAFVTGTLGGLTPVYRIDGHDIVNRHETSLAMRLGEYYEQYLYY